MDDKELIKALRLKLTRERMRLAACGAATFGYGSDIPDEYRSEALGDVLDLYDRYAAKAHTDITHVYVVKEDCSGDSFIHGVFARQGDAIDHMGWLEDDDSRKFHYGQVYFEEHALR